MKKFVSIFLGLSIIFALSVVCCAQTGEIDGAQNVVTDSAVFVNPLYKEVVTESEFEFSELPAFFAEPVYTDDIDEAAAVLREQFSTGASAGTVYFEAEEYRKDDVLEIFDCALEHTGEPTEGDYIRWRYKRWGYNSSYTQGKTCKIKIDFFIDTYTTFEQEEELGEKIDEVLSELDVSHKTSYGKVKAIYDYICANVVYDYENLENDEYGLKFTAYAALIDKTAVCQGYASLFYRMALEAGVDTRLIAGTSLGENHGWNIAEIGGKYYNLDSTWDAGATEYDFFLLNESNFKKHTRFAEYDTAEFHEQYPMAENDFEVVAIGNCGGEVDGTNLEWVLSGEGNLFVGGSGKMKDYGDFGETYMSDAPWEKYKENIGSLIIENGVTHIGGCAFYKFSFIKGDLIVPETVTTIGVGAFAYCDGFSGELVIPKDVIYIGHHAFFKTVIENINVSESNKMFCSVDGILYSKDMKMLILCPGGKEGKINVPESVEKIGMDAFWGCNKLTGSMIFHDKLSEVKRTAFEDCSINEYYFHGKAPSGIIGNGENMPSFDLDDTIYYPYGDDTWVIENGKWKGYNAIAWMPYYHKGDINMDGNVDIMDVNTARRIAAKLIPETAERIILGDLDGDGKITAVDANYIRKFAVKLVKVFPVEEK